MINKKSASLIVKLDAIVAVTQVQGAIYHIDDDLKFCTILFHNQVQPYNFR
jgi:hypothetical protein